MLLRPVLLIALTGTLLIGAAAADDAKAPCRTLAAYLKDYARAHPDQAADTLAPAPTGKTSYDDFLRADARGTALQALDPGRVLHKVPWPESQAYTETGDMAPYALEIDHRRFILLFGQPTEDGWRAWPGNAFGLWEWDGQKLVPVAGGLVKKRAGDLVISVE
jgi:hypothetical protein